ncbi:MAG: aldehyde ferredoxin oxidoreductase N-terminal domain-containing protein [Chloroflexota bacterium]
MASDMGGWAGEILRVDLTTGKLWTQPSLEYGRLYIGARGIAARIAWDEIPKGVGPFDPENRLMVGVGPLTGTSAPNSGRTTICSLSPQAYPYEWFSYSSVGGFWGPMLKYAGYDMIVVQGESRTPVYLWIDDDHVELRDAKALWGHGILATQRTLFEEHGANAQVLAIGQAGENRCRIAIIATGTGSAAGQGGFGAVMGAKKLKAIAVRGTGGVPIAHPEAFSDCTLAIARAAEGSAGCPQEVKLDPHLVESFGQRFRACSQQCSIWRCYDCRHYSKVRGVLYSDKEYSGEVVCESGIFAGNPGTFYDWKVGFQAGFELAQISHDYGLNHWELGIGMVPWLRQCHQEGVLPDLDGESFDLDSPHFWDTLFQKIVYREGIGDALAEGTVRAAKLLGIGEDFVSDLFTAWGFAGHWDGRGDRGNVIVFPYWLVTALQWAMATRDPLSSGHGYAENVMKWSPMFSPEDGLDWETLADVGAKVYGTREAVHPASGYEAKAIPAIWHGHRSVMKDSLTLDDKVYPRIYSNRTQDHFARADGMEGPSFEYHMFTLATGLEISEDAFERMAERVFNLERALQVRNWDRSRRVDEEVIPYFEKVENWVNPLVGTSQKLDREKFNALLDEYYRLRGWNPETGRPTRAKLEELGLSDVAVELSAKGMIP